MQNKEIEEALKMFNSLDMGDDIEFIKARKIILQYIDHLETRLKELEKENKELQLNMPEIPQHSHNRYISYIDLIKKLNEKEKEIEKLEELSRYCALKNIDREDNVFGEFVVAIQKVRNYIEQLENKVKELGKGQHTLMQSRRKWKNKYYKEKKIRREADKAVLQIYEDYQDIGKMYFNLDEKRQQAIEYLIKIKKDIKKDQDTSIYYLEDIEKIIKMLGVVENDN